MRRFFVATALSLGALALASCAPTMSVAKGEVKTEAAFTVTTPQAWSRVPAPLNFATTGSTLTRHGLSLDRVDLLTVKAGKPLLRVAPKTEAPVYRVGMARTELVGLVVESLTRLEYAEVQVSNVRAQQFGGAEGVRFALTGKYPSGLNMRGDVALAEKDGALHVILYVAPATRYFDQSAPEVEAMIESARFS